MTNRTVLTIVSLATTYLMGLATGWMTAPNTVCASMQKPMAVTTLQIEDYTVEMPKRPTRDQAKVLAMAFEVAKADGLQYPQLLQGIVMQESRAGGIAAYKVAGQEYGLKTNERYYGVTQVKLAAARDVLARWPGMWNVYEFQTHTDEEVIARLIEDDRFNLAIASKYLVILRDYGFRTPGALAVAFNKGPGGAQGVEPATDPYAAGVARHIAKITPVDSYYVQNGDSLSKIATALHIDQDVLYNANPTAFVNGDRNVLMAGVTLTVRKA